jgi:hypothetical protein
VNPASTWGPYVVNLGSTWGQSGVNLYRPTVGLTPAGHAATAAAAAARCAAGSFELTSPPPAQPPLPPPLHQACQILLAMSQDVMNTSHGVSTERDASAYINGHSMYVGRCESTSAGPYPHCRFARAWRHAWRPRLHAPRQPPCVRGLHSSVSQLILSNLLAPKGIATVHFSAQPEAL